LNLKIDIVNYLKKYDLSFFGIVIIIFIIGILNLYSATHAANKVVLGAIYKKQLIMFGVAMGVGFLVSFIRPKNYFRFAYVLYGLNIFALILVLIMGNKALGAQRWLVLGPIRFQPSEMMKISVVLALARWYTKNNPHTETGLKELVVPGLIALFPAMLIIVEPDLGTGLIVLLVFLMIAFYRRLKWKTIIIVSIMAALAGGVMFEFGLKNYQKQRILTFLDDTADARGTGYNAIQSKIAIGSGQIFGKGYKKSSQASLNYLPENHTDFVFSIFNEEHGLLGSILLLALYGILFFRFLWLSTSVLRFFDSLLAIGLMSIFFFHTVVNMGMVMGLMPIVGLPLPLMSYGGSSLLTFGVCIGIATGLSNSRNFF
jgi:rod shape determining protein RodA